MVQSSPLNLIKLISKVVGNISSDLYGSNSPEDLQAFGIFAKVPIFLVINAVLNPLIPIEKLKIKFHLERVQHDIIPQTFTAWELCFLDKLSEN